MRTTALLSSLALLATGVLAKPLTSPWPNVLVARQASSPCTLGCTSASDEALLDKLTACDVSNFSCFCTYWLQLGQDPSCAACLQTIDVTGQLAQICTSGDYAGGTGTGAPTIASSIPTASPSALPTNCTSECSSASDAAALATLGSANCDTQACVCTTLGGLSTPCLTCQLALEGDGIADYNDQCYDAISTTLPIPGGATGSATQAPAGGSSTAGSSPTSAAGGASPAGSAASSASPSAAPKSGALPALDIRLGMVVLGGVAAGAALLL